MDTLPHIFVSLFTLKTRVSVFLPALTDEIKLMKFIDEIKCQSIVLRKKES